MNICILSRALPYHGFGGLESHTISLAKGIALKGHFVYILTTSLQKPLSEVETLSNLEIIPIKGTKPGIYDIKFFINSASQLKKIIKEKNIELVHSQGFASFGYIWVKSKPLVTTIHGTITSETMLIKKLNFKNIWKFRKRIAFVPCYLLLLYKSDAIIVDSNFTKRLLLSRYPWLTPKVYTIYLGIDTNRFFPGNKSAARRKLQFKEDVFLILCLGRITEEKGYQTVIEAAKYLDVINAEIVICGEGPYKKTLEQKIKELNLLNVNVRVRLLDAIPDSELPILYRAADVFIYPDLTAPAFGLAAVEAMACGTPVIASFSGALPEIIVPEESGLLFPPGDAKQLSKLINTLAKDISLREKISKNAYKRSCDLFDYERMVKETLEVYKTVLTN